MSDKIAHVSAAAIAVQKIRTVTGYGLYRRALVAVRANTGAETAWVYHMTGIDCGQRLFCGIWRRVFPDC